MRYTFCMNPSVVDEVDLKVINALQVQPRAPWRLVASVVGVDPATAARRWARLTELGAAWIVCYPPQELGTQLTLVAASCLTSSAGEVATRLAGDPHTMTLNIQTGGIDLLAEVVTRDMPDLATYLVDWLPTIPGIRTVHAYPVAQAYTEAGRWRLGALDAAAVARLRTPDTNGLAPWGRELTTQERETVAVLRQDPRISARGLGQRIGVSPATAARRLSPLVNAGLLRCEIARPLSGWGVQATFLADCPAHQIKETARALMMLREVRALASIVGPQNLFFSVWLRTVADAVAFEGHLTTALPHLHVTTRGIVLRTVKRVGRLLDSAGWSIDEGVFDPRQPVTDPSAPIRRDPAV